MRRSHITQCKLVIMLLFLSTAYSLHAVEPHPATEELEQENDQELEELFYTNPEERREAGLGRKITDWLTLSGLLEIQAGKHQRPTQSILLGVDLTLAEHVKAQFTLLADNSHRHYSELEEGFISLKYDEWGIRAGRQYLPFGQYYSHFVTDPILQFGETRGPSLLAEVNITESFELSVFTFDGKVQNSSKRNNHDWGFNLEYKPADESLIIGTSYISDLSESDEEFLREFNNNQIRTVSAWSVYALASFRNFELTAEYLQANKNFSELDEGVNKPIATNLELAYFLTQNIQLAARIEHSKEVEDSPKRQHGFSVTWLPGDNFTIATEYLYGEYKKGFVQDSNGRDLKDISTYGINISLAF